MTRHPTLSRLARFIACMAPIAIATLVLFPAAAAEKKSSESGTRKSSASKRSSPTPKKKTGSVTPKAKATPKPKAKTKAAPKATPDPKPAAASEIKDSPLPDTAAETEAPAKVAGGGDRPLPGMLSAEDLKGFDDQPERVRKMITAALELSKRGLTYQYGSADPDQGGMDCSGAIYYLLRAQGFEEVPRDASGQYVWARKNGEFFAVISKKADSFEFSDLKPGDLLFWNGTYNVDRDPPVTHSMVYLGLHKERGEPVMWGASDGRSYDGKARWGVGVFDFKMPRTGGNGGKVSKADFLGYARIPDKSE